jgi:hypothetical protein
MSWSARRLVAAVCVAGAVTATASAWLASGQVQSEDRNHDGRPDLWRSYDPRGHLTWVDTDTNFDGRADQRDYYDHGALIRRERDRNLDDRVDLIESFDPTTHEQISSVVDVDFNGTADLLVLFQSGQPVFSEWLPAEPSTPIVRIASREPSAPLAPLVDSSRRQAALDAVILRSSAGGAVARLSTMGLPEPRLDAFTVITSSRPSAARVQVLQALALSRHSPRGPPAVSLV